MTDTQHQPREWGAPMNQVPSQSGWGQPTLGVGDPEPPKKKHRWAKWGAAIVGGFILLGVIGSLTNGSKQDAGTVVSSTNGPHTDAPGQPAKNSPLPTNTEPPSTEPPATTKAKPKLTASQEQAIGTAEDYLSTAHFSRTGLVKQLQFEGFNKADATFAVDYLHADWREQAVGTARDYLDTGHFSRSGLINQLEFEGFTTEQATYAAGKVGL